MSLSAIRCARSQTIITLFGREEAQLHHSAKSCLACTTTFRRHARFATAPASSKRKKKHLHHSTKSCLAFENRYASQLTQPCTLASGAGGLTNSDTQMENTTRASGDRNKRIGRGPPLTKKRLPTSINPHSNATGTKVLRTTRQMPTPEIQR